MDLHGEMDPPSEGATSAAPRFPVASSWPLGPILMDIYLEEKYVGKIDTQFGNVCIGSTRSLGNKLSIKLRVAIINKAS